MSVLSRAMIGVLVFFCARVAGATSNGGFQLLQEAERYPVSPAKELFEHISG